MVLVPLGLVIPQFLTFSASPSLRHHLFLMTPSWCRPEPSAIQTGSLVRFPRQDEVTGGRKVYLLKRVGCLSKQSLKVSGKNYYCDGAYLGKAKEHDKKGRMVRNFEWDGPVPDGQFFAIADHKDSYDSRYYGFVELSKVENRAWPLL